MAELPSHAVAIVGLAGRFPGAADLEAFWRNVVAGTEMLEPLSEADLDAAGVEPALRADPAYVRRATVLADVDQFDAAFFGLSPREAQILDPQQRIFLECAWEALEHAGHAPGEGEPVVGVYAGAGMNTYLLAHTLRDPALMAAVGGYQLMLANDKDFLATRVSYKLDLRGPSMTVQTACSTSLVAVELACRALAHGECDVALAGGVSIPFPHRAGYLYQEGMILSPDGHCRPFDAQARGTRPGAGCGIVVLKRLADALADGDTIHAVIRGAAVNNDGAAKAGYTAPSVDGQVEVIATAQALAGVEARSIGYLEAHGTATPLGDPIEVAALTRVFRAATPDVGFCRLGSLKANLGHLDAAAGVAGLIKAVLALEHRHLPPLVNFASPNPQLDLPRSPFVASAEGADWPAGATPRRAGVSSFGIGGTNAHVVLEEAPVPAPRERAREAQLLVLSARSEAALEQATLRLAEHLRTHAELPLADVAWTLQAGRRAFAHRRIVVAHDAAEAVQLLAQPARTPVHSGRHDGGTRPVAFLFSGQGSQHAGMGAGLYASEPVYREVVDRCAELLQPHLGLDLRTVLFAAPGETAIDDTRLAQPALFVTEVALALLWQHWGVRPAAMLGHSIGEYACAHLAGVMSLEDALALVAARGALMQALPPGRMAGVHLGAEALGRWLQGSGVEIAAVNAPGLCTVSGPGEALQRLLDRLGAAGIESRALHTSHAFHSAMMAPAMAPFVERLRTMRLSAPRLPYVSNVTGTWITAEEATSPDYYARHLRGTVQFEAGVRLLAADPAVQLLEVGPGQALASLARVGLGPAGARRVLASLGHPQGGRADAASLLEAAGRLWLAGVPVQWRGLHGPAPRRVPLPTYPFERKRHWVDPAPAAARSAPQAPQARALDDWFWEPSWQRGDALQALGARAGASAKGRWLVFHHGDAASSALLDALAGRGAEVIGVLAGAAFEAVAPSCWRIAPHSAEDHQRLIEAVHADGALAGVIHLWSAAAASAGPDGDLAAARAESFHALMHLARGLGRVQRTAALPVLVLSSDREAVLGTEAVRPARSLLLGPVYSMPLDVPDVGCRTIDLSGPEWTAAAAPLVADCLLAEAGSLDAEPVVAYRGGYRWTPTVRPRRLASAPEALPLRRAGTYLITGGAGGIGLTLAAHLARHWQARLVLVSRSAWPARERWDALLAAPDTPPPLTARLRDVRALEALGSQVLLGSADVADEAQMRAVVEAAQARFGRIDGVVHAAGLLGSGSMLDKTEAAIEAVLRPKVEGTLVLDRVLAGSALDFLLLCSSISTAFASQGMSDYTAANAFQDAFAKAGCARSARRVIAAGWDSWRDVGFAAAASPEAQAALRFAIHPEEGVQAFERVLAGDLGQVYVTRQAMPDLLRDVAGVTAWLRSQVATARPAAEPAAALPAPPGPAAGVEGQIGAIWSELLGIDAIGLDEDFFQLGGHSLLATRVIARIDQQFGTRLTLRDLFEGPSIRRVAEKVKAVGLAPAAPADEDREEIEF